WSRGPRADRQPATLQFSRGADPRRRTCLRTSRGASIGCQPVAVPPSRVLRARAVIEDARNTMPEAGDAQKPIPGSRADSGRTGAGRGVLYIAFAKFYFMLAGLLIQLRLPAV